MRGQKSLPTFLSQLMFVVVLVLSANVVAAQTSSESTDKLKIQPGLTEPGGEATKPVATTSSPAAEAKTVSDPVRADAVLMNANADAPKVPPSTPVEPQPPVQCKRWINADVVALQQPIMLNRLGAAIPGGMIFALKRDTITLLDGPILLRPGKRPRPLVLRANVGDCLTINLTNRIPLQKFIPAPGPSPSPSPSPATSEVSLHIQGMEWVTGPTDDGSFVGKNASSLASAPPPPSPTPSPMPLSTQQYTLYAKAEGTFLMYTMGDTSSVGNQLTNGLFGALNVQPSGVRTGPLTPIIASPWQSEWYRSQVTADDLLLATYNANRLPANSTLVCNPAGSSNCTFTINGKSVKVIKTPDFGVGPGATKGGYLQTTGTGDPALDNHPLIDYNARYPAKRPDGTPIPAELVGIPILKMLDVDGKCAAPGTCNIVHSDLTAIITGPNAGRFPGANGNPNKPDPWCNAENNPALNPPPGVKVDPLFCQNPASPDRKQPYREISILYHGALSGVATQAFPIFTDPTMQQMMVAGQDAFAINYGTGGIGAEIYANRIGVGPMGNCVDCKFEEFFLSAWSVGDPAMLVDRPANVNVKPPVPPSGPQPPPPPTLTPCTAADLGDKNPPATPDPNCVGTVKLTGTPRTGTVAFSNGSATVVGTGTKFITEVRVGDSLVLLTAPTTVRGTVKTITSDTQIVLQANAAASANGSYQVTTPYAVTPLVKATRVYYPDDPSNVYHSYINDHVKFRILHGGMDVTHVHHQHAHQWLQSPNSDQASYLDSQMISPGASYTLEMVYNGSGNRNKVVGDSIFHCHFYPHFAAGMWAMWRTHDTFESGTFVYHDSVSVSGGLSGSPTPVDVSGQVVPGARALPDGEIAAGAPTPALVPMPTLPMAPLPAYAQIQKEAIVNGVQTTAGGQIVLGGQCVGGRINGLDVIGGCTEGQVVNGTVINSQYDFNSKKMVGQFQPSPGNVLQNPGFPYFIPGIAGARAPHPPLDFACTQKDASGKCVPGTHLDGGLPRHVVFGGSVSYERHNLRDWSKDLATIKAVQLAEDGEPVEKAAIAFFSKRCYATFLPDGTPGLCPSSNSASPHSTLNTPPTGFVLNGLPRGPQQGAPFADPAIDDNGNPVNVNPTTKKQTLRTYKAAAIQTDVTFNKKLWHYPQQRMLTLWKDAVPTLNYQFGNTASGRQPEPLFFRGNSGDIIEYWHTNLVPNYYLVDDFQVRTPTDILGQHIHLVKFDVTSSDGAGNGFNYEDGTFSPEEVQEIIKGINHDGGLIVNGVAKLLPGPAPPPKDIFDCAANPTARRCLPCPDNWTPTSRPQCISWLGAQTTIQRWYIDPLVDDSNVDRTMRTVFTHDHFGPSTHQQAGLYAGLLIEPKGSTWTGNDGTPFATRTDGGPTSWQAIIKTANPSDSYREFMLEFQDLQLAYWTKANAVTQPSANPEQGWIDPVNAINAPSGSPTTAAPSLITTGEPGVPTGTQSVNYTNEPIATRVGRFSLWPNQKFSDLSYAFDNSIQATVNPPVNPWEKPPFLISAGDPMTPLLRAYQGDKVQVRLLVGAHVFPHQFNFEGPTWFSEPAWKNSGYRSTQAMGLSEHFELLFNVPSSSAPNTNRPCPDKMSLGNCVDYLYSPSMDEHGLANGLWGLLRSYDPTKLAKGVKALPNNPISAAAKVSYAPCPANQQPRVFNVTAVPAQRTIPPPGIVFNDRVPAATASCDAACQLSKNGLYNDLGIMYVRTEDLNNGVLKAGVPIEPLILRANAGDCIEVNLTNGIFIDTTNYPANTAAVLTSDFNMPPPLNGPVYPQKASRFVGLHPQLLSYDAAKNSGVNVGWNTQSQAAPTDQAVPFGQSIKYTWYAGKIERAANGAMTYLPVEFGSLNLFPSDPMFQHINGLFGQMVIEPAGSKWQCDAKDGSGNLIKVPCDPTPGFDPSTVKNYTRASATVTLPNNTSFREASMMISDTIRIVGIGGNYSGGTSTGAVNYRVEPWNYRYASNLTKDFSCMLSNQLAQANNPGVPAIGDPKTPIFTADPGNQVRFRMTHPFGTGNSQVFILNGHVWQRNPYTKESTVIGNNPLSQWIGSRDNHGSTDHFELVLDKAGGEGGKAGDYLYTVFQPLQARTGTWGLFRVGNATPSTTPNAACKVPVVSPGYVPPPPRFDVERFLRKPIQDIGKP
jgi:manganese oxidase